MVLKVTGKKKKTEDIFGRKEYAEKIFRLIENIGKDGFVLSINSNWGEGKTAFLNDVFIPNMEGEGYTIVYFDAFEHDFFENPLSAITGSFLRGVGIEGKEKLKTEAKDFLKVGGKILLRYIMRGDIPEIEETDEADMEKEISEFAVKEISSYIEAENGIKDFKIQLEKFAKGLKKPLIFVIDELDRCKPSFALEVIEIVKHFFSLENVVFILAINKEQITNYISHHYGAGSDSENYLHKFIDIETELPLEGNTEMTKGIYCRELIKSLQIKNTSVSTSKLISLVKTTNLSLREIEKIINYINLGSRLATNKIFMF